MVITIDGPSASGKSTVAGIVSDALDIPRLDTGAMYRAVTWACLEEGVNPDDAAACSEVAHAIQLSVGPGRVRVGTRDVTEAIREPRIDHAVSAVAVHPGVRETMVVLQQDAVSPSGLVADGRDMGTVVFPDAEVKAFLTATPEARTRRRAEERGDADLSRTLAEIERRDALDASRDVSTLRAADDAFVIDTTDIGADVVAWIIIRGAKAVTSERLR